MKSFKRGLFIYVKVLCFIKLLKLLNLLCNIILSKVSAFVPDNSCYDSESTRNFVPTGGSPNPHAFFPYYMLILNIIIGKILLDHRMYLWHDLSSL